MRRAFLFTDIEGSTRRWESDPDVMRTDLAHHDRLLTDTFAAFGGVVFKHTGDGLCVAFDDVSQALLAAVEAQRMLATTEWLGATALTVRMGIHEGSAVPRGDDYFGPPLNRCARVMSAGHGGQVLVTEPAVAQARELLPAEIELVDLGSHRLRDIREPEHLYQVAAPGLATSFAPLKTVAGDRAPLPVPVTRLIGREDDMKKVIEAVESCRLVTLVGLGGCGKSRLATEVGIELTDWFAGNVCFVSLAPLKDGAYVASTIAQRMGYDQQLSTPLADGGIGVAQRLAKEIGAISLLLVVDNCEHLARPVAETFAVLVAGCPGLHVLATSREVLRTVGEVVVALHPLELPPHDATVDEVFATAAGALFVERAAAARQGFTVAPDDAPAVAAICRRLDGLPLAIELAAARTRMIPLHQMVARLDNVFQLLGGSADRATGDHHQTLLATMQWSYDLLRPNEAAVFRRLAVFNGGFTLDAVEEVCGFGEVAGPDVFEVLAEIVDRSLVDSDLSADGRFSMLEVVLQFARHKLVESGELDETRVRHFHWALGLAQRASPVERFSGTQELEVERFNLRAALGTEESSRVSGDDHMLLAYSLWRYWLESGQLREGMLWLNEALALPHTAGTELEARTLDAAALIASLRGEFALAQHQSARALALARDGGMRLTLAWALLRSALVHGVKGALEDASSPFSEALMIFSEEGLVVGRAWTLLELGRAQFTADRRDDALASFEEALAVVGDEPDPSVAAYGRVGALACSLGGAGDPEVLLSALAELDELGAVYTLIQGQLMSLAALLDSGHREAARQVAIDVLRCTKESGAITQALHALDWSAQVLAELGSLDSASVAWGFVLQQRGALGLIEPALVTRLQTPVLNRLSVDPAADFDRNAARGATMELPDAMDAARVALVATQARDR